jgi:hypothetical protein
MERSLKELMMEYGGDGNVEAGKNCILYNVDETYIKIKDDFPAEEVDGYMDVLDDLALGKDGGEQYNRNVSGAYNFFSKIQLTSKALNSFFRSSLTSPEYSSKEA